MYTLYTDKLENFKCSIDLEGASLSDTQARLVLESDRLNLLYEGKIDANGECTIPINKLKNILKEGEEGTMRLEVIAEDTFFSPWEDQFTVNTNKKVTVEVLSSNSKPLKESRVKVKVKSNKSTEKPTSTTELIKEKTTSTKPVVEDMKKHSLLLTKLLGKKGIKKNNLFENVEPAHKIILNYSKKYKVKNSNDLVLAVFENIIN